ncbi:MAG: hypothetical protein Q9218_002283 [Villophora microphyllina]
MPPQNSFGQCGKCVDGSSVSRACAQMTTDVSNACPASEWYVIRDYLSAGKQTPPPPYHKRYGFSHAALSNNVHGRGSVRQLINQQTIGDSGPWPQVATTQQAIIADALVDTGTLWFLSLNNVTASAGHGSPLSDQSSATHTLSGNYSQPYAKAVCVPDYINNSSISHKVAFPFLEGLDPLEAANGRLEYEGWHGTNEAKTIEHPGLFYSQLLEMPGNKHDYRLRWVELPETPCNGTSIGAVILHPSPQTGADQKVLLCNVAAGWGLSSLAVGTSAGSLTDVYSKVLTSHYDTNPPPISQTNLPAAEFLHGEVNLGFRYHERSNTSLINVLMQQQLFPGSEFHTASYILSALTANGFARTSWDSLLQGDVKTVGPNGEGGINGNYWISGKGDVFENVDPNQSKDWVTFQVDSTLQGYGYNTYSVPPRIAIAVMVAYCLLVVGHTIYSGITGISANCWDTIAKVTALAVNSTPTTALRNTCAGITEMHIFKLPVRVLVSKDEEGEGEHLELMFGQVDDEKTAERRIMENRTYATLPRMLEGEEGGLNGDGMDGLDWGRGGD